MRDLLRRIASAPALGVGRDVGAAVQHWLEPAGPALHLAAKLLYHANALLTSSLFRLTVTGKENLPDCRPYVIVPNHASDLDPLLIAAALGTGRMRHVHFGGDAARLFRRRSLHPLWRALQVFPVDERNSGEALAIAAEFLRRGESLVWFPESWRSPDGRLQRFQPGIGRLLAETRAPVVPARIEGAFEAMPRSAHLPRPRRIRIKFGPAIGPDALLTQGSNSAEAIAGRLHDAVAALG